MRVYISGPITGHDDYRETFAEAEKQLAAAGDQEESNAEAVWKDYGGCGQ